jgi:hypothetical protein
MGFGQRMRRLAPLQVCAAVAAAVPGLAGGAVTGGLVSPAPSRLADIPANPLIERLNAPRPNGPLWAPARSMPVVPVDMGAFQRLADRDALTALATPPGATLADTTPPGATAADATPAWSPPPAVVGASSAPPVPVPAAISEFGPPTAVDAAPGTSAPDPVPAAMAEALDRLILRDDRANPLGAGDWGAARAAIGAFYAIRGFQPVWVDGDGLTAAGRAVAAQIARAPQDGLTLSGLSLPRKLAAPLDPAALAAAEVALASGVVAYAEQASGSRLAPWRVSPVFAARPEVADPGEALAETAAASDPGARLAAFNPPQKGYQALREALRRVDERAEGAAPGDNAAADLDAFSDAPAFSDDALVGAAARPAKAGARRSYLASAAPTAARRASARERAAILANMEIWRWEPRDMGERRIEVNIPDFSVTVMDGDQMVMSSRVVVGKPDTPTTVFSDRMRYVLINPSWEVPDSIIKKEIAPRLDHFTRLGYEVKTVGGRLLVRQPPGDDNALGRLAFMFPNDHAIYLHDTPARQLFAEDMRALSHGCVRVEDPERLAEIVLNWPESRLEAAIGGPERTVFLPRPLPIHIEYFTEFVDADGTLEERRDVYGLTQKVARILSTKSQD